MGAKQPKQKQGSRARKAVPKPRIPEPPADPFERETAVCWMCEQRFQVKDIPGTFLHRRCPLCGGELTAEAYDRKAKPLCRELNQKEAEIRELTRRQKALEQVIEAHPHWWQWPYRFVIKKRLANVIPQAARVQQQISSLKKKVDNIRFARYFTSEWFLSTHAPTVVAKSAIDAGYRISPRYSPEGTFTLELPGGGKEGKGLAAEFDVFEVFRQKILQVDSPLHNARLAPNLYLPIEDPSSSRHALWSQIDLALLTRYGAFVVEVKRRYADIIASAPFDCILSNKPGDQERTNALAPFNQPLVQNARHAVHFCRIPFNPYPDSRVYEITVFVRPRSFSSDAEGFARKVFVGCVPQEEDALVDAVETVCRKGDEIISQSKLDELADNLIDRYGDLNQKRRQLHISRIKNLAS